MAEPGPADAASLVGRTLSHYQISSLLGVGGMGQVYRARDTRLGRDVAIKVLPPAMAGDLDRLARFKREAHLLAALNHPHVASIYGLEEVDGRLFLALELVEGEDLQQRLLREAIPLDETLEVAKQVAEALEEAHGKGIVHRDLKPANVKLTPDGRVKVLDFGLAKAWAGDGADGSSSAPAPSHSPTLTDAGTMAGVVLGTAAYMSPEQARGKAVDKRADVWSFGVLVWEMLTGRRLFTGDTVTDVIAAVVTKEPDFDALPRSTPSAVRRLLGRCLRKDPRTRLPDIGGARLELQDLITGVSVDPSAPAGGGAAGRRLIRERWAWALALLAAMLLAGRAVVRGLDPPAPARAVRFAADAPEGWTFSYYGLPAPSPDGSQIAFFALRVEDMTPGLWIRPLGSLAARQLPAAIDPPMGGGLPFWSPDGGSIGFSGRDGLHSISLADGRLRSICKLPDAGVTADWGRDGTILTASGPLIVRVAAVGGEVKVLTTLDASRAETGHWAPRFLPDGRRFLFHVTSGNPANEGLYVASLDAPADRRQLTSEFLLHSYASGRLLFVRGGTLFAQPFDVERAQPTGEAAVLATSVAEWTGFEGIGQFGVSEGGTLALFLRRSSNQAFQLAWVDRKGGRIANVGAPERYGQIALSPDERHLAFEQEGPAGDLWVMDLERGVSSRVTVTPEKEIDPVWSPDGRSLAFAAYLNDGSIEVRRKALRASEPETRIVDTPDSDYPEQWSPVGGGTLLFDRLATTKTAWSVPIGGGEPVELVRSAGTSMDEPQLSPDGRWLAYMSNESGRYEVYVEPFRREGERVRVSVDGGGQPKWRGDGRELFYATPPGALMAVSIGAAGNALQVGLPAELFKIEGMAPTGEFDHYAPSRDGQRFLVKVPQDREQGLRLEVVTNWTSLLSTSRR